MRAMHRMRSVHRQQPLRSTHSSSAYSMLDLRYVSYYWPVVGLGLLVVFFILSLRYPSKTYELSAPLRLIGLWPFQGTMHVKRRSLFQLALGVGVAAFAAIILLRYYSAYFDGDLTYTVSFDNRAIRDALGDL